MCSVYIIISFNPKYALVGITYENYQNFWIWLIEIFMSAISENFRFKNQCFWDLNEHKIVNALFRKILCETKHMFLEHWGAVFSWNVWTTCSFFISLSIWSNSDKHYGKSRFLELRSRLIDTKQLQSWEINKKLHIAFGHDKEKNI